MSLTLLPEGDLRAALHPFRVRSDAFEAAVRDRLARDSQRTADRFVNLSPALRGAAAFLPLELLIGSRTSEAGVRLAPATGVYKLLSYAAFPAISLFVLLGATIFSAVKIRRIQEGNTPAPFDEAMSRVATTQWLRDHRVGALLVFTGTLALAWIGATWLLFLLYIVSLGILLYVLTSFAKIGLGNRWAIGSSCAMGMCLLGQIAGFPGIGDQDIHFVDQSIIVPVFFCGALVVLLIAAFSPLDGSRQRVAGHGMRVRFFRTALFAALTVSLSVWYLRPYLWPATPARIKAYVESFDRAPFSSASWQAWEIVAHWAVESNLDPDLSRPARLLAEELAKQQNPFILGSAFRVGLVLPEQLGQLQDYEKQRDRLLDVPPGRMRPQPIFSLEQFDWVIRAAVLRNDLTAAQRDFLALRLHASLAAVFATPITTLETPLRATQLLAVIGRPVTPNQYRDQIHQLLRTFHSKQGGGFQVAGGFKEYNTNNVAVGSVRATAWALELMETYGIPSDFDLNWVRSFLRPLSVRLSPDNWIAAVTLDRLNGLPSVSHPTWLETIYYERSLLAALILVGLCIYATLSTPVSQAAATADGASRAPSKPEDEGAV